MAKSIEICEKCCDALMVLGNSCLNLMKDESVMDELDWNDLCLGKSE